MGFTNFHYPSKELFSTNITSSSIGGVKFDGYLSKIRIFRIDKLIDKIGFLLFEITMGNGKIILILKLRKLLNIKLEQ